jgi:manganese/zinc/iron transport system permease protein
MDLEAYFNPYAGQTFIGFFITLLHRFGEMITGKLSVQDIAADETQLLVLLCVASSAALVGSFLVLRKMTMLANSLSHTILLGIVMAYLATNQGIESIEGLAGHFDIESMLLASLGVGILTAFLTEFLTKTAKLQEDASIGLVFTTLFALGILLVTLLTRSSHIGIEVVMGNVDALNAADVKLVFIVLLINLILFSLFFKEYKITTFDRGFAKALGFSALFFDYLLMVQVSATTIGAFRAVGALMVLAFITGPVLASRLLCNSLKWVLILSMTLGCAASLVGVALSRHILTVYDNPLSTGGIVVCTLTAIYALIMLYSILRPKMMGPLRGSRFR